jgi:zinc D-Ala-D-Ala dipeptidase
MAENAAYQKIPVAAGQVRGWKDIPIEEGNRPDPLVPLGPFSQEAGILMTSSVYFGEHGSSPYAEDKNKLEGSLLTLFARRSVARRLVAAERLLPAGHHLLVFDAYRPYQVQKSLHDFYKQKLGEKYPGREERALELETQNYVSFPSTDPARPSPHNTGGAVDVAVVKLGRAHEDELLHIRSQLADTNLDFAKRTSLEARRSAIMRRHSNMLDFGTAFDHGGEKSALAYYESKIAAGEILTGRDKLACDNRRLLFGVMTHAGFEPYFAEWWHFNAPESQMGAAAAGLGLATFGAIRLDEGNRAHENMRREVRRQALRVQKEAPKTSERWPVEIIAPVD